jgi:uroporphyrin-III C-methyltransferase
MSAIEEFGGIDGVRPIVRGKVWLVGAGPGDPELLTVRAARLIAQARVVAYDELVSDAILDLAPKDAERIPVGRRAGGCRHHEARIHPAVVERAVAGIDVVRVKCGDPFIFGRGGEEAEELAVARVPFEIVPGISAALAGAAAAHIPLTHRECASSVTFATAHIATEDGASAQGAARSTPGDNSAILAKLPETGTLVLYMGLGTLERTLSALAAARGADVPAAAVSRASCEGERTVTGTLGTLAARVREAKLEAPTVVFVGEVVGRAVASPADPLTLLTRRAAAL